MDQPVASLSSTYIRSQAVVSRAIAGETLIVPVRGRVGDLASIYKLNETASKIWDALACPLTLRDLASVISTQYDVEVGKAEDDAALFVEQMCSAGLVALAEHPLAGS